ncbi:MAG: Rv1678 family membrane protein [Nocardioidaceae bacterium]
MTAIRWLFAPADHEGPRGHAWTASLLRILVGLLWLYNLSWKRPPGFGQDSGKGVFGFTQDAVDHPVFGPFSWLVEHLVLPNFAVFGWAVLVVETALAVLLLTGAWVRLAALVGILESLAIGLSVAQTPGEWPWSYWMMVGIHVVLMFSAAGSVLAVDALRSRRRALRDSRDSRALALTWGVVASAAGVIALVMSLGDDVFASSGARLGGPGLSIGLGSYNLAGSIVLVVAGLALLGATSARSRALAVVTAVVGLAGAIVVYTQSASSDSVLGGTNTSAAFFLCVAVVGAAIWTAGRTELVVAAAGGERVRE